MAQDQILTFGPYRLERDTGQLYRRKQVVSVTWKAVQVLQYLMARPGQVVSKAELLAVAWPGTVVSEAALTERVQELRQVLGDNTRDHATLIRCIDAAIGLLEWLALSRPRSTLSRQWLEPKPEH